MQSPDAFRAGALANTVLYASAQVNHCHAAWIAPKLHEPGAAACEVLAELLTNEVLHRTIREQGGAYGGRASYDALSGVFRMGSSRDPRLLGTYADFKQAIDWVVHADISQESIEEAIISVIQSLDKPRPPYKQVRTAYARHCVGVTDQLRNDFRSAVLHCTVDEVRLAARTWLQDKTPSRCAFAGDQAIDRGDMDLVPLLSLLDC